MFRCPNCGQGKEITAISIRGNVLTVFMNDEMTEVQSIHYDNAEVGPQVMDEYVEEFRNADGSQICTCHKCNESHILEEWAEARYDSLKYLEMDHEQLCHCGGELWMDQIPGTSSYGFVCEKCNWVKPKKIVSGA